MAAEAMDGLLCDLVDFLEREGVTPVVLSEYGISDVSRSIALNRLFRERGWITVKPEMGTEMLGLRRLPRLCRGGPPDCPYLHQ